MAEVLIVEDELNARRVLSMGLESKGHQVTACDSPEAAEKALASSSFDVVLTDLRMDGRDAGLEVVRNSARLQPEAKVLLLTAFASAETAVEAMRDGAFDYLTKPVSNEELAMAVERALASRSIDQEDSHVAIEPSGSDTLVGSSVVMQRVRERLLRAAQRDFTVLISGESGTGKEVAARFLHAHSKRESGPFVPVHCGAIPAELFESELFGYRRGAFTGADSDRTGLIEAADGGTLFLDEIGEMPLSAQVKLLRVLQEHTVRRLGEEREREVDIRVVAATNRDLSEEVRAGRFREDLFYRLNVVPAHMPPLRQRREDIPDLVQVLVHRWIGEEKIHISPECMARIAQLPFMGNVRELENLLQRMLALSLDGNLNAELLSELYQPERKREAGTLSLETLRERKISLDDWLVEAEKGLIDQALAEQGGNITKAAEVLGISFRSLRYRLKKLGMKEDEE